MFISLAMAIGPATGVFLQRSFNFTVLFLSSSLIALCAFFTSLLLSEAASPLKGRAVLTKAPLVERSAIFPSLIIAILALTYASLVSFLPLFALNRGIENPGLFFTIYAIVVLLTRSFAGWISDRYGRATTIVPGMILASLALGILSHSSSLFMFLGVAFLFGLAFAAVQPALMALAIDRANPSARGAAMGTFTAAMDLGIGAGSFLWGFVAESFGFSNMYIAAGMVSLAGAIIFIWGSKGMMALPYPAPLGKDRETKG
jgi:MFS family permease